VLTALEPFFNAAASQFILGQHIPPALWASLAPIVLGKMFVIKVFLILHLVRQLKLTHGFMVVTSRVFSLFPRCVHGIHDWALLQLEGLHQCHDCECWVHLQEHLLKEGHGMLWILAVVNYSWLYVWAFWNYWGGLPTITRYSSRWFSPLWNQV
jgi:hypothetical protein